MLLKKTADELGFFAGEVGEVKITRSQDQLDDDTTFVERRSR